MNVDIIKSIIIVALEKIIGGFLYTLGGIGAYVVSQLIALSW